jgi:hypothetical protein
MGAKKLKTNGKHDWDALYKEFLESGLTRAKFLINKGIHPGANEARQWKHKVTIAREKIKAAVTGRDADGEPAQLVDLLGAVQQWSLGLAPKHYNASQMLRTHAELFMERSLKIENGVIVGTTLKPREMNALAQVLSHCQKMDRLACGLSTENVAANHTGNAGTHVADQNAAQPSGDKPQEEKRGPVFVVEVNQNGKFVRPRPRMELVQQALPEPPRRASNH